MNSAQSAVSTDDAASVDEAIHEAAHDVEAKAADRRNLQDDVERFLQTGGEITEVPKDFRADPPKKPESNYGRGSI